MDAQKFKLISSLIAIRFDERGRGNIDHLPIGALLTLTGRSSLPGFIEILHADGVCHAFEKDFRDRSSQAAEKAFRASTTGIPSFESPLLRRAIN